MSESVEIESLEKKREEEVSWVFSCSRKRNRVRHELVVSYDSPHARIRLLVSYIEGNMPVNVHCFRRLFVRRNKLLKDC